MVENTTEAGIGRRDPTSMWLTAIGAGEGVAMNRVNPVLLATFMAAGLASLMMAGLVWRRRRSTPGGIWLVVLLVAIAEIFMCYALSYGQSFDADTKIWLINITYAGWLVVAPAFVIYIARVTGRDGWLRPVTWLVLVLVPTLFIPVIWGPDGDDLFFGGGRSSVTFDFPSSSPLYFAFLAYTYLLLAVAATLVVLTVRGSTRLHPAQAKLLIAMALLPWLLSFASFFNIRFFGADPTVLSLLISAVMAFSVTQFRTFDLRPITEAEQQLASDAGVVVIDRQGRLSEMNATAARLLGPGVSPAMGLQIEQVWAIEPAIVAALHGTDLGGISVPSATGNGVLTFEYSPFIEPNGRQSGTLILIREQMGAPEAQAL